MPKKQTAEQPLSQLLRGLALPPPKAHSRYANLDPRAHYVLFVVEELLRDDDLEALDLMFNQAEPFSCKGWSADHIRLIWRLLVDCVPVNGLRELVRTAHVRDSEAASMKEKHDAEDLEVIEKRTKERSEFLALIARLENEPSAVAQLLPIARELTS